MENYIDKIAEVEEGILIKVKYQKEGIDLGKTHSDGSISSEYRYTLISENGYGFYRVYPSTKFSE